MVLRDYLPARLVTPRRDYVFCRYLSVRGPEDNKGRWVPPGSLAYRLSAYGLLFDEMGRVLMVSDKDLNFGWNLPGGGINRGETLERGLIREFEEETGLIVTVGATVATADDFIIMPTGRPIQAVYHFYLVEQVGGTFLPQGNGFDTSEVAYINLSEVSPDRVNNYKFMKRIIDRATALRNFNP